jgi:glucose/arabinose dehydrogenase
MIRKTVTTAVLAIAALATISLAGGADAVLTGTNAFGDYTKDAPGVWRKITVRDLPPPYASPSARSASTIIARPSDAMPQVPQGFTVSAFAEGLKAPRQMKLAPNGDIFLAESGANQIRVIRAAAGAASAANDSVFAEVASKPYGIAFFPPGPNPEWVYVASTTEVVRFPYRAGDTKARGAKETIIAKLPSGGHWTRDVIASPDGKKILVSVGSSSNIQDNGPEAERGRADILEFNPDGSGQRVIASGTRNPVTIAFAPQANALWAAVQERDLLGDNLPPDYVTHIQEGGYYGWPYFYAGNHRDARVKGTPPVPGDKVVVPDVLLQPHSAVLGMAFYTGNQFPAEYRNDIFAALHGSWNRANRTGYKLIRIRLRDGHATGEYEDFMTGFVTREGAVWGRPVGVVVAQDGSLLMSDDLSGTIWRIAYSKESGGH